MINLVTPKLTDERAERARREHDEAIRELQASPLFPARIVRDVSMPDATNVIMQHGFGRPVVAIVGAPRGASTSGRIEEIRATGYDRSKVIVLKATGWGATITADVVLV